MTLIADNPTKPHVKRWTKRECNDLVEKGAFRKQRVYLYRGELIEVPAMGSLHAFGISNITEWLCLTFAPEHRIRIREPFETWSESMPEPDGAVVTREQMARLPHPNAALLLIEVRDSSVEIDQEKAFDYAAAGVPEYWIVYIRDGVIEVYRDPVADASKMTGFRYAAHRVANEAESLSPLAKPGVAVKVADLVATS